LKNQQAFQNKNGLTKRAPDVWDSAAFSGIFLASSFSCSQAESTPAHTQVTQTVSHLVPISNIASKNMSNFLTIKIHEERILISSADGLLLSNSSSLVEIDEDGIEIRIDGISESLQGKPKVMSSQTESKITFCNPFLLDDFRPKLAAKTICYLVYTVTHFPQESQDKITNTPAEWRLSIAGYENLDKKIQGLFEFYIQNYSWAKAKILSINNQPIVINRFEWAVKVVKLGYVFTYSVLLLPIYLIFQSTAGAKPATLSFFIGLMIVFVSILLIAAFVYFSAGKWVMKKIIPYPVYKAMIEDVNIDFSKWLKNFLRHKSPSVNNGG